jgi:hypothetical protein
MKSEDRAPLGLAAIVAIALLGACAESKTGSTGTGAVPTEKFESLVAGTLVSAEPFSAGVAEIEIGAAPIRKDDDANAGAGALRLGMNFEGAGTVTGAFGTVPLVLREGSAQYAVRGPIISVDAAANRFTVATLTVIVDGNTLYDSVAGVAALAPGSHVEVAGLPLADLRMVLATRVTQVAPGNGGPSISPRSTQFAPAAGTRVELEGIALNVAASGGFLLRTPARDYDVAPGAAASAPVTSGARVRVVATATGPSPLASTSVTVIAGQIVYRVTGAVSELSSLAALRVRGEPVDLTTAVIRGGNASDIANGRRLAIVGTAGPGALRVSEATLQP